MTRKLFRSMMAFALLGAAIQLSSCKGKKTDGNTDTATTVATDTASTGTTPVVVAEDDALSKGVTDATKDFPGVTADVKDGEITLSGNITRDKLQTLMMSLNSLHPKKINNNLTIAK